MSIESLPWFIEKEHQKYFLTINRDLYGKWSAGYILFNDGTEEILDSLFTNSSDNLTEIAIRMSEKVKRYKLRNNI